MSEKIIFSCFLSFEKHAVIESDILTIKFPIFGIQWLESTDGAIFNTHNYDI